MKIGYVWQTAIASGKFITANEGKRITSEYLIVKMMLANIYFANKSENPIKTDGFSGREMLEDAALPEGVILKTLESNFGFQITRHEDLAMKKFFMFHTKYTLMYVTWVV